MVTLIVVLGACLLVSILCFDLLEVAIRRVLLLTGLIVIGLLFAPFFFILGVFEAMQKDQTVINARKARNKRYMLKINAVIVKAWAIPVKTALLEPHIRKAVSSGLRDGIAMHSWWKRSQFNPSHPFTVWHPVTSTVKGNTYLFHKGYARATRTKVKDPQDFTLFDVLP